MLKFIVLFIGFYFLNTNLVLAQYEIKEAQKKQFPWPEGKKCAVSLTFDDARLTQIDKGIPLLDKYGIKATFYVLPCSLTKRLDGWKKAVASGYEIGNHSTTHPCTGNYAFSFNNALENYNLDKISADIDEASKVIKDDLGVETHSFAYPCGQKFVGQGQNVQSYVPIIAERFLTGRGWLGEAANNPWICDFSQLLGMESDGKSFEQLKALIEQAKEDNSWLILAGHEMDTSGSQTTLLESLDRLCQYMNNPANGIWVDTVENIALHVKNNR